MVNKAWELRCIEEIERDIENIEIGIDIEIDIDIGIETHILKDNSNCSFVLGSEHN